MKACLPLCALLLSPQAGAYMVADASPLADMIQEADFVLKARAVVTAPTDDPALEPMPGYAAFATRLQIISVLKGHVAEAAVLLRHYDVAPNALGIGVYSPPHYHFDVGASYLVFAKATRVAGILHPLWDRPNAREAEVQLLAADDAPVPAGRSVQDAIWHELAQLAASRDSASVKYALARLQIGRGDFGLHDARSRDFPRDRVLTLLRALIHAGKAETAAEAIRAVGYRSPYREEAQGVSSASSSAYGDLAWLATVGQGRLLPRGQGTFPKPWDNPDARTLQADLIEVANRGADSSLRALAIRALGHCQVKSLVAPLRRWSKDASAPVRAAAASLWADFPGPEAEAEITRLAADPDPRVRRAVIGAVGFLQAPRLLPLLKPFLAGGDAWFRGLAALSAVAFDPRDLRELLEPYLRDPDVGTTFVNALALGDPKPYLDDLARIVVHDEVPRLPIVSQMPVYTSWQILLGELGARSSQELASGRLDKYLDALERPPDIGSSPYLEVYQLYLDHSLTERAARFRRAADQRVSGYDLDQYFKEARPRGRASGG